MTKVITRLKKEDLQFSKEVIEYFRGKDMKTADKFLYETAFNNWKKGHETGFSEGINKMTEEHTKFAEDLKKQIRLLYDCDNSVFGTDEFKFINLKIDHLQSQRKNCNSEGSNGDYEETRNLKEGSKQTRIEALESGNHADIQTKEVNTCIIIPKAYFKQEPKVFDYMGNPIHYQFILNREGIEYLKDMIKCLEMLND